MFRQMIASHELLTALWALKSLLARVRPPVPLQLKETSLYSSVYTRDVKRHSNSTVRKWQLHIIMSNNNVIPTRDVKRHSIDTVCTGVLISP